MSVTIRLPAFLKQYAGGATTVAVEPEGTVGATLRRWTAGIDGLSPRVFKAADTVQRNLNVFLNEDDIRFLNKLDTPVKDGDEISVISGIAGG